MGALVMLALSLALVWLPLLGPLIAGFVGGRIVGRAGTAMLIALLPAIVLTVAIVALLALFDLPVVGAVAGVGLFLAIAIQDIPLIIGAYAGGAATQ
ncbi:MAG: hypothetical protein ACRDZO_21270 [Egibacteraceae bacterium]